MHHATPVDQMDPTTNIYQIAGLDHLGRGFNRRVEMKVMPETVQAIFRYEHFLLEPEAQGTERAAVAILISQLQDRGYTQLRSRLQFRGEAYLGNQELWEEHLEPEPRGILARLLQTIRSTFHGEDHCQVSSCRRFPENSKSGRP